MPRFCTNCGGQVRDVARFCTSCGQVLATPVAQTPTPLAQPPPYTPQAQGVSASKTFVDRQQVLADAPRALNRPDQPWAVTIDGYSIIAQWKWMDATFFSPHEINDETKQFTFIVTLTDNGKWKELDKTENTSSGVKMSGGKLSFGSSSNTFKGKTNQKSFQLGAGRDKQTGEVGIIKFKFDTAAVKQPIREYLTACGWKK